MSPRFRLILVTAIAVVGDSLLIPFYPHFFTQVYGETDPEHVGFYIAASCFTVMAAFPFWAFMAKRISALRVLIATQMAAGILSALCTWSGSLLIFWFLSLAMFAFKASYLLLYPYMLSLEPAHRHAGTIGLLSVIVHLGGIFGSLAAGLVFHWLEPRHLFLFMAACDTAQALICLPLAGTLKWGRTVTPGAVSPRSSRSPAAAFIYKLAPVMLLFYFSAFLIRPFFTRHWESLSGLEDRALAGLVFAIPGVVAVVALWLGRRPSGGAGRKRVVMAVLAGLLGCLLQASSDEVLVLTGRGLFGWALFHGFVRLDLLLFERSNPESYATDFSKINVCQQLGVLLSSFAAGSLVGAHGLRAPFYAAAAGFLLTAALSHLLLRPDAPPTIQRLPAPS